MKIDNVTIALMGVRAGARRWRHGLADCPTSTHWHAPGKILVCEVGKHVYVEKPAPHNIREGRLSPPLDSRAPPYGSAKSLAFRSLMKSWAGAWVIMMSILAAIPASCGVTPQAQNTGTTDGGTASTGGPK